MGMRMVIVDRGNEIRSIVQVDGQTFFSEGVDTQQLIAKQQPARDAGFLLDSGYLAPRSVRLGVSLSF